MSDTVLSSIMGRDMAVDLGTANTLVYVRGRGHRAQRAVRRRDQRQRRPAARRRARGQADDRPHAGHIQAIRPLKDGVIADFEICEKMLRYFIHEGAPAPLGQAPHGHLRAVGHHRRRAARRAGGGRVRRRPQARLHHRGAHGRGHRRRAARAGADRQHDRRHRRRHHRGRGHLARRHRDQPVGPRRRRRARRRDHPASSRRSTASRSASARPKRSRSRSARRGRSNEELHAEIRGRDLVTGLPKTIVTIDRGDPRGHRRAGVGRSSTP